MPVYRLIDDLVFPPPQLAESTGLLAVGGDLRPERLLLAYRIGIFPWYSEDDPILWFSPDPRMVLRPDRLHVPRSLRRTLRRGGFRVTLDADFAGVIRACARVPRPGQEGTWITSDMIAAYEALHALGHAHSIEVWRDGGSTDEGGGDGTGSSELVGGLYGVATGGMFAGESMFALVPDASKVAFVLLVTQLRRWGYGLVDCQIHTDHVARFGAEEWPRDRFLTTLEREVARPGRPLPWTLDDDLVDDVVG